MSDISAPFVLRELNTIGYKEAPDEPARIFGQWSFLYLISGEVLTYTGGNSVLCKGHNLLLVPPGTEFRVRWYKDSIGYVGGFDESILKDGSLPLLRITAPLRVVIPYQDEPFADELLAAMFRYRGTMDFAVSAIDLLLNMLRPSDDSSSILSRMFLDDIFGTEPVTGGPGYYAALYGLTESELNKTMKEETGRTAGAWIAAARLSKAKVLLKDGALPMSEVSARAGFEDQSYFARFFKKYEGVTPSQYRRDILKKS